MAFLIPNVVERIDPDDSLLPLVLDSPHSGSVYPPDFGHSLAREHVRLSEDAFIDELYATAPACGATLIRALFPRSYIDPNRAPDDLDPAMFAEPWPGAINPGPKTRLGVGLIPRREPGGEMYDRKLGIDEVRRRINDFWIPYHETLRGALDDLFRRFHAVWHLNCHSMPSMSTEVSPEGPGVARPQICLGDRDGTTCAPEFTHVVAEAFTGLGYEVTINAPYKGVELIRRYSDPAIGRHSLQVEINRALYMDEERVEKSAGFAGLADDLTKIVRTVCDYAEARS
ncbi:MAG: N-formylglutamate amidohydrolase [Gammaproteobacteria bacterium]|nr:N-formylglutamate amidohydrolase [Gammaproteobacteria bacterium]